MDYLIGKRIARDIVNKIGITVVPAQTFLTHEVIKLIVNHKIDPESILFAPDTTGGVDKTLAPPSKLVQQAVTKSKQLFESITVSRKVPLLEFRQEVLPAIQDVSRNPDVFELFEAVKAKDDYTYQHNIGVGVLATLIGRWMNLSEVDISVLSLAATLHDVGKVKLPIEVLNKPGKLTNEEYELVKKHTIYGYELLKNTPGISHAVARVALQHHERDDGRGYPLGLKRDHIDRFSSIVAVADIFHAMSSKRPYHEPLPFYEILSQMSQGKFGELNPTIVSLFVENMMKKLVGKRVRLTDGREGEVVYLNPHRLEMPLIKIEDEFLDLSKEDGVRIQEIITV
ncbi:HD-GYP domain-containing protein [Paenibacillus ginsengarvi]|uniref:HD-GYP domain-containing protein n=1 Tax=Paenibacillus ginsengarvi TaxID=400777 RepID=A0A3B0AYE6_9BACL|nr:HD-GYP domain-containing protein [Paenibacillus ginsengarvi]RKN65463.1 HD-GYP domain-containing protein [Paenibacillus ginsengarvi]